MTEKATEWKYAEELGVEGEQILRARAHARELGIDAVSPGTGALLAVAAAATSAENIMEIGTGAGVSGLWMLHGAPDATLTSIDIEVDHQQLARQVMLEAGYPASRIRLIAGRARDVLPRMNENAYDVVLVDADPQSVREYVAHGLRMVRPGGIVVVAHALWRGRVADPAQRDDIVTGLRGLLAEVAEDDSVVSSLAPVGDGVLQLVKRA